MLHWGDNSCKSTKGGDGVWKPKRFTENLSPRAPVGSLLFCYRVRMSIDISLCEQFIALNYLSKSLDIVSNLLISFFICVSDFLNLVFIYSIS